MTTERYRKTWGTPIGQDCISLDHSLCAWLALRLAFLAEHCNSYDPEYGEEGWSAELRKHAAVFADYKADSGEYSLEKETASVEAAQASLRWIAEHLPTLWD